MGIRELDQVAQSVRTGERCHRGFNLFLSDDLDLFVALVQGEHTITGMRNRDLRPRPGKSSGQSSRMLKRLRVHGLIKKARGTTKYYATALGRRVVAAALRLREEVVVPTLSEAAT